MKSRIHISGLLTGAITCTLGCVVAGLFSMPLRFGSDVTLSKKSVPQPGKIEFKPMIWPGSNSATPAVQESGSEGRPTELFCNDKRILPVWKQLKRKRDQDIWEHFIDSYEVADCSKIVEVMYFNLDGKGANELLVRGGYGFCGATGNCAFWIFKKEGKRYREILEDSDYIDISKLGDQILKTKSQGHNDILVKGHMNASDTAYTTYKYRGGQYRISSEMVDAHDYRKNGEPFSHFITLKKWSERGW